VDRLGIARQWGRSGKAGLRAARRSSVARLAGAHRSLDPSTGRVALTFDDGPDPSFTPDLLDVLRGLEVPATFFLTGQRARQHPDLVRRMLADGHSIGSHSSSHPDPWTVTLPALVADYRSGRAAVEEASGRRVSLFRPPKGYLDGSGAVAVRAVRLRPWLWTIDSLDWKPGATTEGICAVVGRAGPGDVILLHDSIEGPLAPEALDRGATVSAVPHLVRCLRDRGLEFVGLS
jgi:peptidoglycan-N-acetylglucosamine deacetylase